MTTLITAQKTPVRNSVQVPCPKDLKERFLAWLGTHENVLETFKSLYAAYLDRIDKNWSNFSQSQTSFKPICENVEYGIRELIVDVEGGMSSSTFHNYCKFVRHALAFQVSMKMAKLGARKLGEIRSIAIEQFGGHTSSSMSLAYDVWLRKNKLLKQSDEATTAQALRDTLEARGVSIVAAEDLSDNEHIVDGVEDADQESGKVVTAFVSRVGGKRGRGAKFNGAKPLDSPFGLATISQIPDFDDLSQQMIETLRRWFEQEGFKEWLDESSTYKSVMLKAIRHIVCG